MILCDCMLLETAILFATALFCYYLYYLKTVAPFWSKRNVPHVEPQFLFGNTLSIGLLTNIGESFHKLYKEHKHKRILGIWGFHYPSLAVFDREIIKNILTRDFSYFHDRITMEVGDHDILIKGNLFNLNGHAWRNMRVKLSPTFTSGKMKMMYPTIHKCGEELKDFLKESAENGTSFDLKDISARYSTNVIGSCAFGIEVNALQEPDSEFRKKGKGIFDPTWIQIFRNILMALFPPYGRWFKVSQLPQGTTEFFVNLVKDTMEYRKLNSVQRKDFMQLMIELKEKGKIADVDKDDNPLEDQPANDTKFTLDEAAAQAFVFFAAGFETSSVTMSCACFELAKNKDVQKKLKDEIRSALKENGGSLTFEAINKLDYLNGVVHETLRKYPNVPVLLREASKDFHLPEMDVVIPKKTVLLIPYIGLAHDPEFFPNPDVFDPLRFSAERKHEIVPYTHIPFGEGPRICIGNRFGVLQVKVGLVAILSNYTVEACAETPNELKFGVKALTLTLSEGVQLKLSKDESMN